jgi:hypothetical protein
VGKSPATRPRGSSIVLEAAFFVFIGVLRQQQIETVSGSTTRKTERSRLGGFNDEIVGSGFARERSPLLERSDLRTRPSSSCNLSCLQHSGNSVFFRATEHLPASVIMRAGWRVSLSPHLVKTLDLHARAYLFGWHRVRG